MDLPAILATTEGDKTSVQFNQVLSDPVPNKDGLPEWIQLTPGGNRFSGRDGRIFRIKSPRALVRGFNNGGEDLQVDIDHESEFGFSSTAASGWLTEMELRTNREIWGRIEWTPDGAGLVTDRVFRGISPAFIVDRESVMEFLENPNKPMEVTGFQSVALTNRPNLPLRSLNTERGTHPNEEKQMDPTKLFSALGLGDDASLADALTAINVLKDKPAPEVNSVSLLPDLSDYVPRADYEQVQTQLNTANTSLEVQTKATHAIAVDTAVKAALSAGKVAPASEGYHRQCCSTADGLAKFQDYVAKAPAIVAPNVQVAPVDSKSGDTPQILNDAQDHLCKMWGFTTKQFQDERTYLVEQGKLEG